MEPLAPSFQKYNAPTAPHTRRYVIHIEACIRGEVRSLDAFSITILTSRSSAVYEPSQRCILVVLSFDYIFLTLSDLDLFRRTRSRSTRAAVAREITAHAIVAVGTAVGAGLGFLFTSWEPFIMQVNFVISILVASTDTITASSDYKHWSVCCSKYF